jgi:N-acetylmuramoyl-L-alanine amidase
VSMGCLDKIKILCYHDSMRQTFLSNKPTPAGRKQKTFAIIMTMLVVMAALLALKLFTADAGMGIGRVALTPVITATLAIPLTPTRDLSIPLVGIVSGHKGYDPGAVCPDGLTEGEVNYAVAVEVVNLLERRGIKADLLNEFDPRLKEYQANALVSIHADSCAIAGASGFKAARVTNSAIPLAEDALVACINREYAAYTGLPQHPASITDDMTNYHAFNEIAPSTPGAIIETGFLLDDRYLLEQRPKVVARGIAAGIMCFLEGKSQ